MSTASTVEREMLALINQERTSRGLDPLQLETQLNESSEDHSAWMLETDRFSHTGAGGSSATQRMQAAGFDLSGSWRTGENIAWQSERGAPGISDDVAQLHQNLMNSPGHRANILNPDFMYIGIGIETGDMQGYDAVMVTQNFATTQADVDLDLAGITPPADEVVEIEEEIIAPPEPETPEADVTEPEEPVAETTESDVTETEEPVDETPETDVTETEEPSDETPETEVTDTEEPSDETPATDVTETEEPSDETPETDVTEVEDPEPETPVAEVEDPEPETPVAEAEDPEPEAPETDTTEEEDPAEADVTDVDDPIVVDEDPETPETIVTDVEDPAPETPDVDIVEEDMPEEVACFDVQAFLAEIEAFVNALQARFDQFEWAPVQQADATPEMDDFDLMLGDDPVDETVQTVETTVEEATDDFCGVFVFEMNCNFDFG